MALRRHNKKIILILVTGIGLLLSCKKDFLNKIPSSDLVVPTTLDEFQALLDNDKVIQETPELGELSADNYYLQYPFWQTLPVKEKNAYIWAPDIYGGQGNVDDWDLPYTQVYYSNLVLEGLPGIAIDSNHVEQWRWLQGTAYFVRAYAFYNQAQLFANVYGANAGTDAGIPLRLKSDPKAIYPRATVQATYTQIINDLKQAENLLPVTIPYADLNRPSKPAALAMLARVYLSMRDYTNAGLCADSCLQLYHVLMDYHTVKTQARPFTFEYFPASNTETIYQSHLLSNSGVFNGVGYPTLVDSNLYRSYADSDLRKTMFYTTLLYGAPSIQGSYSGTQFSFSGLATDEVYLIRAECSVRLGNKDSALNDLDTLLIKRWRPGSFVPYNSALSQTEVLDTVLTERRKELAFRGLRWTDLRRLNADNSNIILTRSLNGAIHQLLPTDPKLYIMPIPPDVITLGGISQNQR